MQMYSNIRITSGLTFTLGNWALLACALVGLTACKSMTTLAGRVKAVHVHFERSIDIDSLLGFEMAEFLFARGK
jgi:hypothetical protein